MSKSYMPSNDPAYNTWLENFNQVLSAHLVALGLTAADLTPLQDAQTEFGMALADHIKAKTAAQAATSLKIATRDASESLVRPLVQRINHHPGMTDQLRSMLGLIPNHQVVAMTPIQQMVPEVFLDAMVGQVVVHWGPNPQNERANGKPVGVKGANIYLRKVGEAEFQMVGFATRSPFYDTITGEGANYSYVVRYRGTKQIDLSAPSVAETIAARGDLAA